MVGALEQSISNYMYEKLRLPIAYDQMMKLIYRNLTPRPDFLRQLLLLLRPSSSSNGREDPNPESSAAGRSD